MHVSLTHRLHPIRGKAERCVCWPSVDDAPKLGKIAVSGDILEDATY